MIIILFSKVFHILIHRAASSQYLILSQSMPMNMKIGHANFSYLANYSQPLYDAQHISRVEAASANSAPYANANTHIQAPNVSNTYSRINENSASIHTPPRVNSSCVSSYALLTFLSAFTLQEEGIKERNYKTKNYSILRQASRSLG